MKKYFSRLCGNKRAVSMIAPKIEKDIHSHAYIIEGPKGSGKTQQMIEQANKQAKECRGNVVFIKKTHRDTASVAFDIRTICMEKDSFSGPFEEDLGGGTQKCIS